MADEKLYSGEEYKRMSEANNLAQLWSAQGVGNDYLQSLAAGTTFETGGAEVGYKWKVVPTAKGNTVELLDNWTKNPVNQTQALSYVQTPNSSKQQVYAYDMNEVQRLVDAFSKTGRTNYQVVYISPDGDPYKRRVYDIAATPAASVYAGPTNVTGPTAGTLTTPESLINSVTQQPTAFPEKAPAASTTPAITGTTTQTGAPVPTVPTGTPINQQITTDAVTGAETATPTTWRDTTINTNTGATATGTQYFAGGSPAQYGYQWSDDKGGWYNPSATATPTVIAGADASAWSPYQPNGTYTNAQNQTWRTLPISELEQTGQWWNAGVAGSSPTAGSNQGYTMNQPQYSYQLFQPSAQLWNRYLPSEQMAYKSAVQSTGTNWDDIWETLKKKWGAVTPSTSVNRMSWTPAGYNK